MKTIPHRAITVPANRLEPGGRHPPGRTQIPPGVHRELGVGRRPAFQRGGGAADVQRNPAARGEESQPSASGAKPAASRSPCPSRGAGKNAVTSRKRR